MNAFNAWNGLSLDVGGGRLRSSSSRASATNSSSSHDDDDRYAFRMTGDEGVAGWIGAWTVMSCLLVLMIFAFVGAMFASPMSRTVGVEEERSEGRSNRSVGGGCDGGRTYGAVV